MTHNNWVYVILTDREEEKCKFTVHACSGTSLSVHSQRSQKPVYFPHMVLPLNFQCPLGIICSLVKGFVNILNELLTSKKTLSIQQLSYKHKSSKVKKRFSIELFRSCLLFLSVSDVLPPHEAANAGEENAKFILVKTLLTFTPLSRRNYKQLSSAAPDKLHLN